MNSKKIATILNLIEIADNNLKTAKSLLAQMGGDTMPNSKSFSSPAPSSNDEKDALEVVEGFFDGESMIGDNGQTYLVPPNYASKTQLVVGDRMKWILTPNREIFKLIQSAPRERATGTFTIEDEKYMVIVDRFPNPIQILKASATYAMKNLGLQIGDEVAITIPKDATPTWGAFNSIVKSHTDEGGYNELDQESDSGEGYEEVADYSDTTEISGEESEETATFL